MPVDPIFFLFLCRNLISPPFLNKKEPESAHENKTAKKMFKIISSILLIVFAAFRPITIRCGLRRMDRSMRKIRNRFHIRGMCIGGGVPPRT